MINLKSAFSTYICTPFVLFLDCLVKLIYIIHRISQLNVLLKRNDLMSKTKGILMTHHIFYGEIRNQIASELLKNPDLLFDIELKKEETTIFTLCSEAARIFHAILDLSGHCLSTNITEVIRNYSSVILNQLVDGKKLTTIDLVVTASETIQKFC